MVRRRVLVESVICDRCNEEVPAGNTWSIGFNGQTWDLDLCAEHQSQLRAEIDRWATIGALRMERRSRETSRLEWEYLESLGFVRHPGRRSSAERRALDERGRKTRLEQWIPKDVVN